MLCGARCFVKEKLATDRLEAWGPLASREKAGWAARSGSSGKNSAGPRAARAHTAWDESVCGFAIHRAPDG